MNVDQWFWANAAWERQCEEVALGYATETAEYAATHPRPTFKEFLIGNAGIHKEEVT